MKHGTAGRLAFSRLLLRYGDRKRPRRLLSCWGADTGSIAEIDSRRISPEMADVRSAGFALLLEEGRPVPPIDVVTASGVSEIEVEARVAEAVAAGRARLDDSGDLIGIAGLSVVPTGIESISTTDAVHVVCTRRG